jgi:hypothetical protein
MGAITSGLAGILVGILQTIGWEKLIVRVLINLLDSLVASTTNKLTKDIADPVKEALQDVAAKK